MPANGDGTYEGAGGSEPHAAASHATAMRTTRRVNFFMWASPGLVTSRSTIESAHRASIAYVDTVGFIRNRLGRAFPGADVHISRNTSLPRCNMQATPVRCNAVNAGHTEANRRR